MMRILCVFLLVLSTAISDGSIPRYYDETPAPNQFDYPVRSFYYDHVPAADSGAQMRSVRPVENWLLRTCQNNFYCPSGPTCPYCVQQLCPPCAQCQICPTCPICPSCQSCNSCCPPAPSCPAAAPPTSKTITECSGAALSSSSPTGKIQVTGATVGDSCYYAFETFPPFSKMEITCPTSGGVQLKDNSGKNIGSLVTDGSPITSPGINLNPVIDPDASGNIQCTWKSII